MNTFEYQRATAARKNVIMPGDVHPALRAASNCIARNALDVGLPDPVFPVTPPKTDSATIPVGSEYYIVQVWDAHKTSGKLTISEARERYESALVARRAMEIRANNYRIGQQEAQFMAKQELQFTPRPSDRTTDLVIATARQLQQVARGEGRTLTPFQAVEQAVARFR